MPEIIQLRHIFIDHSNIWGGARLASRIKHPQLPEISTRISIKKLDVILGGRKVGVSVKIVSGGIPPGMEGMWAEYEHRGYDTQRLFRDEKWKERGVDHTIIGHMWRLLAQHRDHPITLALASGDGKRNEFGTSFYEILKEILGTKRYPSWNIELYSFDWPSPTPKGYRTPTSAKMKNIIENHPSHGKFINLMDHYDKIVYHQK